MKYDFETLVDRSNCGSGKWDQMKQKNPDVKEGIAPLSVADMEFKNAPEIIEGLKEYLDTHVLGYTSPTDEYRAAVCKWMKEQHDWEIKPEWIACTHGVVAALFMLVGTFCEKGDGIIVMPPVYYPFYAAIEANGCNIKKCPLIYKDGAYSMDFELLDNVAAESDSKMLILCSPHNPVGRVWTADELKRLGEICKKHGVRIVSDEIHNDIIMPGYTHTVFHNAGDFKDVIVCTAPSKTFNLATMQTSNIIIPNEEDRKAFAAFRANIADHDPSAIGLEACRVAYERCKPWMEEMIEVIHGNYKFCKDFIAERLPEIKVVSLEGTYLMWLDCRALGLSKEELEELTVMKAQLFLDEGYVFGDQGEGFERVSLAAPRWVIQGAMERFEKAVREKFPKKA